MQQLGLDVSLWWRPLLAALAGLAAGLVVRGTLLAWLGKFAAKTAWKYDDVLVKAIKAPVVLWFVLIGFRLAVRLMPLTDEADATIGRIILVVAIMSVAWAVARFSGGVLHAGAAHGHLPGVSLLANLARVLVMLLGALVVLQTLGIAISPVIATLGIGGLAVGLALQDTLASFFAGLRIIAAKKIRPGDLIKLDTGQEGFVEDINWGLTTLREGAGNLIIVPNTKLASAIVINYALPASPQNVTVELGVGYDADLEKVETIALDVALQTLHAVPEAVSEFVPALRFREFGEYAIRLFVVLQARSHQDRWAVVSDFIKRLHQRFAAEGIVIPVRLVSPASRSEPTGSSA